MQKNYVKLTEHDHTFDTAYLLYVIPDDPAQQTVNERKKCGSQHAKANRHEAIRHEPTTGHLKADCWVGAHASEHDDAATDIAVRSIVSEFVAPCHFISIKVYNCVLHFDSGEALVTCV